MNDATASDSDLAIGDPVFDAEGREIGRVRGVDTDGLYVGVPSETGDRPLTRVRNVAGRAYVMWRCWDCGEMGRIEGDLPETCPNCGAPREDLYYWAED